MCPCPLTTPSNQFGRECYLDADRQVTCRCAAGYTGRRCGECSPGYVGNPARPGGNCQPGESIYTVLFVWASSSHPEYRTCVPVHWA